LIGAEALAPFLIGSTLKGNHPTSHGGPSPPFFPQIYSGPGFPVGLGSPKKRFFTSPQLRGPAPSSFLLPLFPLALTFPFYTPSRQDFAYPPLGCPFLSRAPDTPPG